MWESTQYKSKRYISLRAANKAVHKDAKQITEYVEIPKGLSSATPVISPGPGLEKIPRIFTFEETV